MPSRNGAPRVPADLRIIVGVQVNEPGRDHQPVGIDDLFREARRPPAYLGDLSVFDPNVAAKPRHPSSVDDRSAFNLNIEISHRLFPPVTVRTDSQRTLQKFLY